MDAFQLALLVFFVGLASAQMLTVKFTEGAGGKLEYNVTTAVLAAELLKLALAAILDRVWSDTPGGQQETSRKSSTWNGYILYAIPSLIYAVANNLIIYDVNLLGPGLFSLFSNLKIVTTTLLTSLFLSKHFTSIQWISVALLVLSFFVARVDLLMDPTAANCAHHQRGLSEVAAATTPEEVEMGRFSQGLAVLVVLATLSASAAISNEHLLKNVDSDVSLMRKNMWTYQWGASLNFAAVVLTYFKCLLSEGSIPSLFDGYSSAVWCLIVINAVLGLSVSMIMKYFDNVVRCFAGAFVVYFTSTFSYVYFGSKTVNGPFGVAAVLFTVSSFLFMGSHNNDLPKVIISGKHLLEVFGLLTAPSFQSVAIAPEEQGSTVGNRQDQCTSDASMIKTRSVPAQSA